MESSFSMASREMIWCSSGRGWIYFKDPDGKSTLTRIYSYSLKNKSVPDLLVFAPKPFVGSWIEPDIHSFIAAT
jgi:hypothetical protein